MAISKSKIEKLILKASKTTDLTEKQLLTAAIVAAALKPLKITPILVGGAAVQLYTFVLDRLIGSIECECGS